MTQMDSRELGKHQEALTLSKRLTFILSTALLTVVLAAVCVLVAAGDTSGLCVSARSVACYR